MQGFDRQSVRRSMQRPVRRHGAPRLRQLALACAVAAGSAPAWGIDYVWLGGNGDWTDPSRWSPAGSPGAGDGATLGSGTATLDVDRMIASLTMSGGTRAGSGVLTTTALSFASGTLSGAGSTIVTGVASFNGSTNQTINSNHFLALDGGATWSAGNASISAQTGGNLRLAAGTTFTDAGAATSGGNRNLGFGNGGFHNAGTYERNGLGTTNAYAFNNTGTINLNAGTLNFASASQSSGTINVAAGTLLNYGGGNSTVSGNIANAGLVRLSSGSLTMTGSLGGAVQLDFGTFNNEAANTFTSLQMTGGTRAGAAALQVGTLDFNYGFFVGNATTTITGAASFNGTDNQYVRTDHVLMLDGGATWSVGSGYISAQTGGSIHVAAGTTFTDAGAATSNAGRHLGFGGGGFHNAGTYERNGLGTTNAYAFSNSGTTNVNAGTLAVNNTFANTGLVHVKAGAVLAATSTSFANAGTLAGDGTVRTVGNQWALENTGVVAPGAPDATGALTAEGDLRLQGTGTLQVHLSSLADFDLLSVTDDLTIGGTLNVVNLGYAPVVGDQFVIVTFAQRLQDSVFDSVTWSGFGSGVQFGVVYNANDITLGVLAVPEPATWALWLAGVAGIAAVRRRRVRDGT